MAEPTPPTDAEGSDGQGAVARSTLDEWRAQGARGVDPMRFDFLEALARRTAACDGAARRLLDEKLATAMARYRADVERAGQVVDGDAAVPAQPARRTKAAPPAPGALAQLLAQTEASRPSVRTADDEPAQQPVRKSAGRTPAMQQGPKAPAAPAPAPVVTTQRAGEAQEALAYFRRTWTRLDARRRLAQSQASLPVNAGPLNSQQLVHRALTLMQGAAPGYLHQLMAYVDALSMLEPFQPSAAAAPAEAARADSRGSAAPRKAGRAKRG